MKQNWLEMYDKVGFVLRVETVINQPEEFRVAIMRSTVLPIATSATSSPRPSFASPKVPRSHRWRVTALGHRVMAPAGATA